MSNKFDSFGTSYSFNNVNQKNPIVFIHGVGLSKEIWEPQINFFKDNKFNFHIKSIKVDHGKVKCNAFIVNNKCAYLSDVNRIYKKDYKYFKNLKYFVIDCLRYKKHPSHYNLEEVLNLIKIFKPKKSILTNLHADLDYNYLLKVLPKNIVPAYDGMSFFI